MFPPRCRVCGRHAEYRTFLCSDCFYSFIYHNTTPEIALAHPDPHVESVYSLLLFNHAVRELLHALKYENMPWAGRFFGTLLGHFIGRTYSHPLLVPIPLHPVKFRERGYNQSVEIGRGLCEYCSWSMNTEILKRVIYTTTQTAMNRDERRTNMLSAFRCREKISPDQLIILIDDVYTTGATTSAAAEVLWNAGARSIHVVTVATPLFTGKNA